MNIQYWASVGQSQVKHKTQLTTFSKTFFGTAWVMGVSIKPGSTALHRMPYLFPRKQALTIIYPFTPKSDQFQMTPATSPDILHHTVFHSFLKRLYHQFSLPYLYKSLRRAYFLNLEAKIHSTKYKYLKGSCSSAKTYKQRFCYLKSLRICWN